MAFIGPIVNCAARLFGRRGPFRPPANVPGPPKQEQLEGRQEAAAVVINQLCSQVHKANEQWWRDLHTGERLNRNVGEMLMLVTSELAEALEGHRKGLMDDKLPHRKMIEVELADAVIRIFDTAAGLGLDLGGAFVEKMAYNAIRADHKPENRKTAGGKAY